MASQQVPEETALVVADTTPTRAEPPYALSVERLSAWFGASRVLNDICLDIATNQITAIIGPSGCGKSTFIRCFNRMNDFYPSFRMLGRIVFDGKDIYAKKTDPIEIRLRIGMVFQKPNPFPKSIYDNVASGPRMFGVRDRARLDGIVEDNLKRAFLWDEVKDSLRKSALELSGGQQQRLCIARALAMEPEILLLDEPCSALDPLSTARIEELLLELKKTVTLVIVTHNMSQATRVSDCAAFLLLGRLVEHGPTSRVFTTPQKPETEQYITGRFG